MSKTDGVLERGIYDRELDEREDLIEECPIDIYVPSINPRYGYPHKLMTYYEDRPGVRDSATHVIIDSGKTRVGEMDRILESARDMDADQIVPPDTTPFVDGYEDLTAADHAYEQAEYYWDWHTSDVDADLLLPLHPNHGEYADELSTWEPDHILGLESHPSYDCPESPEEIDQYRSGRAYYSYTLDLIDAADGVAVGGLLGMSVSARIDALRTVRARVGRHKHVHALAPGTEPEMLLFLRQNPNVIDSMDISTPESAPGNGKIADATWKQHLHLYPPGFNSTTVRGMASLYLVLQLNYMLGPWFNEEKWLKKLAEASDEDDEQETLSSF